MVFLLSALVQPDLVVSLDPSRNELTVQSQALHWTLSGPLPGPARDVHVGANEISFACDAPVPVECSVKWHGSSVRFHTRYKTTTRGNGVVFPNFNRFPEDLHPFSYEDRTFAPPSFKLNETSTPWLLFNPKGSSFILSPASEFMVAKMIGDGKTQIGEGLNVRLKEVPAGTNQDSLLTFAPSIHEAWESWGAELRGIYNRPEATKSADPMLRYYGYWTDNGADYYYNYDQSLGYANTLLTLAKKYKEEGIPLHYLQLDSWWYSKTINGPDGRPGGKFKNSKLPEGEWNRYGGLLEYKAHPALFPKGLEAFDQELGLPLAVHNRWIDKTSPYHDKYKISGVGAVDPAWWRDIADYLKESGVHTYEQDWLVDIYAFSPAMSSEVGPANQFTDNMAQQCAKDGLYLQYCMATPRFFLQGVKYPNLTTIRTSDDRFERARWHHFLYTSQLATAIGSTPWCDVFKSSEAGNLILSVLSDSAVGTGDAMGKEDLDNLHKAMLPDGTLVKPDRPMVPLDRTYQEESAGSDSPFLASTETTKNHSDAQYVFAFRRKNGSTEAHFNPAELGGKGDKFYFLNLTNGDGQVIGNAAASLILGPDGYALGLVAPIWANGLAVLGDLTKIVPTSAERVLDVRQRANGLEVTVQLGKGESKAAISFYGETQPTVKVSGGKTSAGAWDEGSHQLRVPIFAEPGAKVVLTVTR